MGETRYLEGAKPFAQLEIECAGESFLDGCTASNGHSFGSYLHGLFDDDSFRHAIIASARAFYKLAPATHLDNWKLKREESLNRLADAVRASLDLSKIFAWVGLGYEPKLRNNEAAEQ
jgi:adenosylcobyric acid synthase